MVSAPKEQKGRALAPEEIRALLEACVDDAYPIVATAVLTGMRRGDVFGLRWSDIDFDNQQGENLKYIQVQMGHSSITVTLDVYGHLIKGANQAAAEKTDTLIFGSG